MTREKESRQRANAQDYMPDAETVAQELGKAESMDDFFGKDGIFARLFANTLEQMMEAELTEELGYEPYETKGRNSGISRNGYYSKKVRTSEGDTAVRVPRDRQGDYEPKILRKYASNTNELEEKVIGLYAKGMSTRDIQDTLHDLYGVELKASSISTITENVWPLVETWQNRPLDPIYPFVFLDALHIKLRRDGKVENTAVYVVLGVNLDGHRAVLGHWIGDGSEGANFWLSVVTDLQSRGVEDIFIASVDGLAGFAEAIQAIFPKRRSSAVSFTRSATACVMCPGRTARPSLLTSRRSTRPRPASRPKSICSSWLKPGVASTPLRSGPGRPTGWNSPPSSIIRPIFAALSTPPTLWRVTTASSGK